MDFRGHFIKKALDQAIRPYRPEENLLSRLVRIAVIAALALVTVLGFMSGILNRSPPRPAPPASNGKPVSVEILPAPASR